MLGRGEGNESQFVDRIAAFAYLVGFLATVAMLLQDPRGRDAMQRLQPLKASLEGVVTVVREFCLRKREVAAKPTFIRMLVQLFNEDIAELWRALIALGIHLRRFAANFPTPMKTRQVPLSGFLLTREWLTKAEVTMTGVDEKWIARLLTGALNLGREEAGKERKAKARTTDDGQKIWRLRIYGRERILQLRPYGQGESEEKTRSKSEDNEETPE